MLAPLLLLPIGFAIALFLTMVGLGGGVFFVPLLVLGFGLPIQKAIGISVLTMSFTTVSATLQYARQKRINYRVGLLLDALDVPGAVLGAYLTTVIAQKWLAFLFGLSLFLISAHIIRKPKISPSIFKRIKYKIFGLPAQVVYLSLVASFVSGMVAGMLGAGGGTIDETVMIIGMGMPVKVAAGTSVFGMALTNGAAAISHLQLGNILTSYAIPLAIGAVCGAQLGPLLSKRIKEESLRKMLAAIFVIIGFRMILTLIQL